MRHVVQDSNLAPTPSRLMLMAVLPAQRQTEMLRVGLVMQVLALSTVSGPGKPAGVPAMRLAVAGFSHAATSSPPLLWALEHPVVQRTAICNIRHAMRTGVMLTVLAHGATGPAAMCLAAEGRRCAPLRLQQQQLGQALVRLCTTRSRHSSAMRVPVLFRVWEAGVHMDPAMQLVGAAAGRLPTVLARTRSMVALHVKQQMVPSGRRSVAQTPVCLL
jgi:hypothetical protein